MQKLTNFIFVAIAFGVTNCHSQGALSLDVQNDNGNSELILTASTNLQWANNNPAFYYSGWSSFGNSYADSLWQGPSNQTIYVNLPNFATVTDISSGQSANIEQLMIGFTPYSEFGTIFVFIFGSDINPHIGDYLQISPASAVETIPIPFADFSSGSVTIPANSPSFPNGLFNEPYIMTVESAPEPPTFELFGMTFTTAVLMRKRICKS